jgi:PAS domain S-box-containing protein
MDLTNFSEDLEDLYQHAPCGYLSLLPDGKILNTNETLLNWLGFARGEILSLFFQSILPVGDRILFETHIGPLIQMQGFVKEINLSLVRKDKTKISVLISAIMKRELDSESVYTRMTIFDISDRKMYETQLRYERNRAETALKNKVDFLSMLTHEIRTPMNAVIGISNLLHETKLTDEQRKYSEMLRRSSENLMDLLNSFLDLSKIESGKYLLEERSFNLRKLAEDITFGHQGSAREKGIILKHKLSAGIPDKLVGDPVKIGQIISNLISNAIKFTPIGYVALNVSIGQHNEREIEIHFEVEDSGIGIPPDRVDLIFNEYTQADYNTAKIYGGTGLGLTMRLSQRPLGFGRALSLFTRILFVNQVDLVC